MKVIIAGSRNGFSYDDVVTAINKWKAESQENIITEIVCGCAKGVDTYGEQYGIENGIPVKYFPAFWDELGNRAGIERNCYMGNYADAAIVLIYERSKGSVHMHDYMRCLRKPVMVVNKRRVGRVF